MKHDIRLIGAKNSHACKEILTDTNIRKLSTNTIILPDLLVNYGLPYQSIMAILSNSEKLRGIPIINKNARLSKFQVLMTASDIGILIPDSKLSLSLDDNKKEWIEKRIHSIGGLGIRFAGQRGKIPNKYYQRFVRNRVYEARVHAFSWINSKKWVVQKRIGDQREIAWNFKNNGLFVSINKPYEYELYRTTINITKKLMNALKVQFCASDFIICKNKDIYFLEINSAPGFQDLSRQTYISAFNKLQTTKIRDIFCEVK